MSAQSSDAELKYDVVLCSLGSRYSMYCATISRTYLVDPNKTQEAQYKALLEAQEAAIAAVERTGDATSVGGRRAAGVSCHYPRVPQRAKGEVGRFPDDAADAGDTGDMACVVGVSQVWATVIAT